MAIKRFYSHEEFDEAHCLRILQKLQQFTANVISVQVEKCYHVETTQELTVKEEQLVLWLLKQPQSNAGKTLLTASTLISDNNSKSKSVIVEIGPRFNFSTPFSTNCANICHNVGLKQVTRLEISNRYLIIFEEKQLINDDLISSLVDLLGDRMTQCQYTAENIPRESFNEQLPKNLEPWHYVPIMKEGHQAVVDINDKLGLAFGDWDIDYYTKLFRDVLKRDPTTVELFDCAQSNSEHSRHWFFRGKMILDGVEQPKSLIRMIMDTQNYSNANNTIKFSDNSSAIRGFRHATIRPKSMDGPGPVDLQTVDTDLIFTAETHNMPTAVAPFSGATTGTGGRLRDVQGVGRGGLPIAGTAGYCVGCLNIPGYEQAYEPANYKYPSSFANPLKVLIEASNGASDYGNKFGEPLICGFVYSYGQTNAQGERDEYVKPIMFSGGMGLMEASMREKHDPQRGMLLAKIGGPVYRIGVGGGAASSVEVQGSNDAALDFNAVQRGDAEMENKLNRVVRACIEMGDKNPILAIHDQGAGGNGNVLKELVEPGFAGAIIFSKEFQLGDPTINALELWGAEYQENDAILCHPENRALLERICERERCPISFVGVVTGNGRVTLVESAADFERALALADNPSALGALPFDLELKHVLGEMPKREYHLQRLNTKLLPLSFDASVPLAVRLERVLSLASVGSKRYLTNKVDRCVTGLVAQQQCVGPLHTPLADFALVTVSHFTNEGIASSIGTQPIKGLLNAAAMARLSIAEALSNLVFVRISDLADVKCSGNWMWAAKLPGEGAKMYDACVAMCDMMRQLSIAVDGGKDSLSMAAKVAGETLKSPGTLVISTYAPCPDVRIKVTPDLKGPAVGMKTALLWLNIEQQFRLGGSALAQAYSQQGMKCPDVQQVDVLAKAFQLTQQFLQQGRLLAGHDISDGGLLVCLVEMAIAGLSGLHIDLSSVMQHLQHVDAAAAAIEQPELAVLFAEEIGWVLEVKAEHLAELQTAFTSAGVPNYYIGNSVNYGLDATVRFTAVEGKKLLLQSTVGELYKQWEHTSFQLEKLQAHVACVQQEYETLNYRTGPKYVCDVDLRNALEKPRNLSVAPRVAVLREEGLNSDREMMACLLRANFEVHDVTMSDLLAGKTNLQQYRGVVFPGGFSYADTLGSAKGWAANIMFSSKLAPQFQAFKRRTDTFSLGICNGCQLMSLIGWVGETTQQQGDGVIDIPDVALLHNQSERFECRWVTLRIAKSKALMLRSLQDAVLGCWVAHGEGRFNFRTQQIQAQLQADKCITMQYVDDNGMATETYPMNPNGSVGGIAGLCSADGRHLALMPHPERSAIMYQWPYISPGFKVADNSSSSTSSPWQLMFNDAYTWCTQ